MQEATKALRGVLGDLYMRDDRNIWVAMWQDWAACRFVVPDEPGSGVLWFRK
jgi:hypothetical protein